MLPTKATKRARSHCSNHLWLDPDKKPCIAKSVWLGQTSKLQVPHQDYTSELQVPHQDCTVQNQKSDLGLCSSDLGLYSSDLGLCRSDLGLISSDLGLVGSDLGLNQGISSDLGLQ